MDPVLEQQVIRGLEVKEARGLSGPRNKGVKRSKEQVIKGPLASVKEEEADPMVHCD